MLRRTSPCPCANFVLAYRISRKQLIMTHVKHNIYINIARLHSAVLCVNNAQYFYMYFGEKPPNL